MALQPSGYLLAEEQYNVNNAVSENKTTRVKCISAGYEHEEFGSGNLSASQRKMVANVLWEWRKYKRGKKQ